MSRLSEHGEMTENRTSRIHIKKSELLMESTETCTGANDNQNKTLQENKTAD